MIIITFSTAAISLTSIAAFIAILKAIYHSSSRFILRQYLSRAIDASPALLFHPFEPLAPECNDPHSCTSHTPPSYIFTPSFGLKTLLASRRAAREGRLEELWTVWLRESGNRTVEVRMLGTRVVLTDEGGNVEEVCRGGREEWGDGGRGWFGRNVLGQEEERWKGSSGSENLDLDIENDVEMLVDKAMEGDIDVERKISLEGLCEKLSGQTERRSCTGPKYGCEDSMTMRYDDLRSFRDDKESVRRDGPLQDSQLSSTHSISHLLKQTLSILTEHPNILSYLHTSLIGPYNMADFHEMTYLSAVLHETRRMYPLDPLCLRQAQKDTYLPHSSDPDHPLLVPKGAYVACFVGSLNRRTELFGLDAEIFKPERWLGGSCRPGRGYELEEDSVEMQVVEKVIADLVKRRGRPEMGDTRS